MNCWVNMFESGLSPSDNNMSCQTPLSGICIRHKFIGKSFQGLHLNKYNITNFLYYYYQGDNMTGFLLQEQGVF